MASRNNNSRGYDWSSLKKGYYDLEGYLRRELIVEEADKIGKRLVKDKLSRNQLRNFYNEVKALDAKIDEVNFYENLPFILMLKAKASYAYKWGRTNSKIPESFYEFIETNIEIIEGKAEPKTFKGFVKFFETVVAYFYGHGGEDNR